MKASSLAVLVYNWNVIQRKDCNPGALVAGLRIPLAEWAKQPGMGMVVGSSCCDALG